MQANKNNKMYYIISVHGTHAQDGSDSGPAWWQKDSDFSKDVLSGLCSNKIEWIPYHWDGNNSCISRSRASLLLSKMIDNLSDSASFIAIISHSHGGNIANKAILSSKNRTENLVSISVGTPYLLEDIQGGISQFVSKYIFLPIWVFAAAIIAIGFAPKYSSYIHYLQIVIIISSFAIFTHIFAEITFLITSSEKYQKMNGKLLKKMLGTINEKIRAANINNPKIYSKLDEAINSLTATHKEKFKLISNSAFTLPLTIIGSLMAAGILIWMDMHAEILPKNLKENIISITTTSQNTAIYIWLVIATTPITYILSRYIFSPILSKGLDILFLATLKNMAFGRDTLFSKILPHYSSSNLPLMHGKYKCNEIWQPLPNDIDELLTNQANSKAQDILNNLRSELSKTYSNNISIQSITKKQTNSSFLIHCSYHSIPIISELIAWILCHQYKFPQSKILDENKNSEISKIWDSINPNKNQKANSNN